MLHCGLSSVSLMIIKGGHDCSDESEPDSQLKVCKYFHILEREIRGMVPVLT